MTYMSFMPELIEFLIKHGHIYTVRKFDMAEKNVEVELAGTCRRIPLGQISTKEDLLPYVDSSGFSSVEAWWNKIRYFIPRRSTPKYLYKVVMTE